MDKVRERIAAGTPAIGPWVTIGDPLNAEIIGRAGYDCVCLDAQHGGVTFDDLLGMIQALDLGGTRALVRVPSGDQALIMRALDLGALGVVVPMVSTREQAESAARACAFPPDGVRSFGPVRNYYGGQPGATKALCIAMIETAEAMRNLDAIASVEGIDGLLIGPVDLGLSLGVGVVLGPNDTVFAAIDEVVAACRRHGKFCGSAALGLPYARTLAERGVGLLLQGSDAGFIRRGAADEIAQMRGWALGQDRPADR